MYEDRNYLIIPITEVSKINFSLICETSADTLRKSVDETKTFIKWDGEEPEFIADIDGAEGPYMYEQIIEIMNSPEWSAPMEEI